MSLRSVPTRALTVDSVTTRAQRSCLSLCCLSLGGTAHRTRKDSSITPHTAIELSSLPPSSDGGAVEDAGAKHNACAFVSILGQATSAPCPALDRSNTRAVTHCADEDAAAAPVWPLFFPVCAWLASVLLCVADRTSSAVGSRQATTRVLSRVSRYAITLDMRKAFLLDVTDDNEADGEEPQTGEEEEEEEEDDEDEADVSSLSLSFSSFQL